MQNNNGDSKTIFIFSFVQDLVPVSREVTIPFEYHRYIIGQKGREVRTLMEDHNLNIAIPPPDKKVGRGGEGGRGGREGKGGGREGGREGGGKGGGGALSVQY